MRSLDFSTGAEGPSATWPARPAGRGTRASLWFLRLPDDRTADPLAARDLARVFAAAGPEVVLAAPSEAARALATAIARSAVADFLPVEELREPGGGEEDAALVRRAWPALERVLKQGAARALFVLSYDVIRVLTALALGIPPRHSRALQVDPGRAVLLLDDFVAGSPRFLLRRSNAAGPGPAAGAPPDPGAAPCPVDSGR